MTKLKILALIICMVFGIKMMHSQETLLLHTLIEQIKADPEVVRNQYVGQTIEFEGFVVDTGISRYLTPYVDVSDSLGGEVLARCVLPYGGITRGAGGLANFSKGQKVTMSGRVQSIFHNTDANYPNIKYGILTKESKRVEK